MRLFRLFLPLCLLLCAAATPLYAQKEINLTATVTPTPTPSPTPEVKTSPTPEGTPAPKPEPMSAGTFGGMRFRAIGPAATSGRVNMFAVDPNDRAKYYVAVASGGVWKPSTPERPGRPSLITKAHFQSAQSRSMRKILRPSGSERANTTASAVSHTATAFTARTTAGEAGKIWV